MKLIIFLVIVVCMGSSYAQVCDSDNLNNLNPNDFEASPVLNGEPNRNVGGGRDQTIRKPTQIAFIPNNSRYIFFTELLEGNIKRWDMQTQTLTTAWHFNVSTTGERGMTGLVFHPNFEENNWVFVGYNPTNSEFRLARFEYNLATNSFSNEKILINHPIKAPVHHYANGQLAIDNTGVLFVPIGSDSDFGGSTLFSSNAATNAESTASNTNSFSGGILRIIPDSSSQGYRIPPNNFGEFFKAYFDTVDTDVAQEYETLVKPELFAKGIRTAYSVTTHPTQGWVAWGEVNNYFFHDEYNITKYPIFSGYPYFHQDEATNFGGNPNSNSNPSDPIPNNSTFNTGASYMPPMFPPSLSPIRSGVATAATVGAIYEFNSYTSNSKFPKAFDQTIMLFDFELNNPHMYISELSEGDDNVSAGSKVEVTNLIDNVYMNYILDAEFSPAGELYIMNVGINHYGDCSSCGSIEKVIYTGEQCPLPTVAKTPKVNFQVLQRNKVLEIQTLEKITLRIYDLLGKEIFVEAVVSNIQLELDKILPNKQGLYFIEAKNRDHTLTQKLFL